MDKVEAENRNDEIEYKGFQDLRGLFKAHLGATKKIEERQNLKGSIQGSFAYRSTPRVENGG